MSVNRFWFNLPYPDGKKFPKSKSSKFANWFKLEREFFLQKHYHLHLKFRDKKCIDWTTKTNCTFCFTTIKVPRWNSEISMYIYTISLFTFKCHNLCIWQFYYHFWSFFCQLHGYLSQNLGFDVHFDVLNVSKFQSDQKIQHKKHFFGFHFFSILEEKILKTYDS